jgi:site-specific DNA-methyltransferase (adenine-specific)
MKFVTDLSKGILGQGDSPELWTEIISHIPDSVLLKPDVKILSVACGHCTEAVIIAKRMMDLGISKEKVRDSIWLIDKYQVFTNPAKVVFGFTNVITADFLEWKTDMKFSVVVGNPPYKNLSDDGKQTNKSIWKDFLVTAGTLTEKSGYIVMVHPMGWGSPSDNGKLNEKFFTKLNLIYADVRTSLKTHFPGVGSTFSVTITKNEKYSGATEINADDGTTIIDFRVTRLISNDGMKIIKKLTSDTKKCTFKLAGKHEQYPGEGFHFNDKPVGNVYKNIHQVNSSVDYEPGTSIPVRYSVSPSAVQGLPKVVIPYNGPANVIVDSGIYGVGWCQYMKLLPNEIKGATDVFKSKLFTFFSKKKHTQYNETKNLNLFPKLDLTRSWTDQELYQHFNLTQEEIDYIEKTVK